MKVSARKTLIRDETEGLSYAYVCHFLFSILMKREKL